MMKIADIRQKFIDFFVSEGHQWVASSSLVPHDDPTLLFTNAGMNQFKNMFLGLETPPSQRIVTVQKCLRAGGKHNDLENVGYTARHHTFFEMLGNFSLGDYFKKDAIRFAWTFLVSPQWLHLPTERLLVTVYEPDEETYNIWHNEIGLPQDKIIRIGDNKGAPYASDNFWQMGDTGPCGPCTEIFYDHGNTILGGPPGSPDEGGDRFTEIWNCVFMQFNRDASGALQPLPNPSVDTGMGLERIGTVMQGVHSNYSTDLFQTLIADAAQAVGMKSANDNPSLKVIADHIRACAFLIADDVLPANESRGYVLRRIIRRAARHGYKLGQKKPFLHTLVTALITSMGDAYPQLRDKQTIIEKTLHQEESRFAETLDRGMALLNNTVSQCIKTGILPGDTAFLLYDTFGFPVDLTADICKEQAIHIDMDGFELSMQKQRQQSQQASQFKSQAIVEFDGKDTSFDGYTGTSVDASIIALYRDGQSVNNLSAGQSGIIVLDRTPFYAESGGQVGDIGQITALKDATIVFQVTDTQKIKTSVFGHMGSITHGAFNVGDVVKATIDTHHRDAIARNHSATHLLHAALRQTLGEGVAQKGSLITAEQIRFDFSQSTPLSTEQLNQIEKAVNDAIVANNTITVDFMAYNDAIRQGTIALFNEKYGDQVRVLTMGNVSRELCGGTHAKQTGDIGFFKIISEHGVAAGVRRIEAITAETALMHAQKQSQLCSQLSFMLKARDNTEIIEKLTDLQHKLKHTEKQLSQTQDKWAKSISDQLITKTTNVNGINVISQVFDNEEANTLRKVLDELRSKCDQAIIVLVGKNDMDASSIMVGVTPHLTHRFHAGKLVGYIAEQLGGKGGGRADMAQGSVKQAPESQETFAITVDWIQQQP